MESTQNTQSGRTWQGLFQAIKAGTFKKCLKKSQRPQFQCLQAEDGQMPEWLEAGGGSTAWRMLDAQYWGVPQRRKRIYLVRDFRTDRAGQILFECESVLGYAAKGRGYETGYAGQTADCASGGNSGGLAQGADGQLKLNFEEEEEKKHTKLDFGRTGDRIYIDAKQSVTLMGRAGGGAAKTGYYLLPVYTIIGNVLGRKAGSGGNQTGVGQDISPTLTESDRHAVAAPEESWRQKYRVRSLTPLECERLDGFPDNWTQYGASGKEMSSNARIKALGNSIAVPCAERVFRGIIAAEQEERKDG